MTPTTTHDNAARYVISATVKGYGAEMPVDILVVPSVEQAEEHRFDNWIGSFGRGRYGSTEAKTVKLAAAWCRKIRAGYPGEQNRHWVIFPIRDMAHRPLGFGASQIDAAQFAALAPAALAA